MQRVINLLMLAMLAACGAEKPHDQTSADTPVVAKPTGLDAGPVVLQCDGEIAYDIVGYNPERDDARLFYRLNGSKRTAAAWDETAQQFGPEEKVLQVTSTQVSWIKNATYDDGFQGGSSEGSVIFDRVTGKFVSRVRYANGSKTTLTAQCISIDDPRKIAKKF